MTQATEVKPHSESESHLVAVERTELFPEGLTTARLFGARVGFRITGHIVRGLQQDIAASEAPAGRRTLAHEGSRMDTARFIYWNFRDIPTTLTTHTLTRTK